MGIKANKKYVKIVKKSCEFDNKASREECGNTIKNVVLRQVEEFSNLIISEALLHSWKRFKFQKLTSGQIPNNLNDFYNTHIYYYNIKLIWQGSLQI